MTFRVGEGAVVDVCVVMVLGVGYGSSPCGGGGGEGERVVDIFNTPGLEPKMHNRLRGGGGHEAWGWVVSLLRRGQHTSDWGNTSV